MIQTNERIAMAGDTPKSTRWGPMAVLAVPRRRPNGGWFHIEVRILYARLTFREKLGSTAPTQVCKLHIPMQPTVLRQRQQES